MIERIKRSDGKKDEDKKDLKKGWIDKRKYKEEKRQKKKIFCIIDLL